MKFWLKAIRAERMTKFLAQGHRKERDKLCGYDGPIGRGEGLGIVWEFLLAICK